MALSQPQERIENEAVLVLPIPNTLFKFPVGP